MSVLALLSPPQVGLVDVVRTARLPKIAPVPLLAWSGYALAHGGDRRALAWATLGVVAISILVTRLNVLTDETLDRTSRPELARGLRRSAPWIASSTAVELGVLALTLLMLSTLARGALVALAISGALYSYNFLARDPVASRLKTHWLGHALAFVASYVALWSVGAAAARAPTSIVIGVAIATGVADYAVYVGECAIDHDEEARAGLRTTAALLGPKTSSLVALATFALGVVLHVPWMTAPLALAFVPPLALRGAMLGALAWAELTGRPALARQLRLRAADGVFLGARVWTFATLAWLL